jgi:NitT/TauT family transport system substrate-binding protein
VLSAARPIRWIVLAALAVAACGGGSTPAQQQVDRITVGLVPIVDVVPVYLGIQQGFFKAQRLSVEVQTGQGGAAVVTSVVSGSAQFGFSNTTSEILALSKGLKLKAVAPGAQSSDDPNRDAVGDLVRGDGSVRSCRDLEGRTIAVNQVANIAEVTLKYGCEQRGANVSSFKFVEVAFPDMLAELQKGRVDAISTAEPFTTQALQAGARAVCYCFVDTYPHLTVATYFTTAAYASQHPDVVRRFTAAIQQSLAYTQDHPDEARQALGIYTQIPPPARQAMVLPYWSQDMNKPSIQKMSDVMVRYGLIPRSPDLSSLYVR